MSSSSHPQEIAFDDPRIRVAHNLRAAVRAFHLLRSAPQHVSEVSAIEADLAFGRDFESLLGAALVLELGHFDFPYTANRYWTGEAYP